MRGKATFSTKPQPPMGITPAYAGKRPQKVVRGCTAKDHPRLCGEKFLLCKKMKCNGGSPPPMRGKDSGLIEKEDCGRITPAYAGKRSIGPDCHQLSEDHPRLCGEKSVRKPHSVPEQGSPPPMRGKVRTYSRKFHYTRITPAYAGKRCRRYYNFPVL